MPKLYKAIVEVDVVVCVLDDQDPSYYALREAAYEEVRQNGAHIMGVEKFDELSDIRDLPEMWDGDCLPYCIKGSKIVKNNDKSINDFLKEISEL